MKALATLGITQGYISYNNPKGNADTAALSSWPLEKIGALQDHAAR
jgi:hypothetical protein